MIGCRAPGIGQGQDPHRQEKSPRGSPWSPKTEQARLPVPPCGAPNAAFASLTSVLTGADEAALLPGHSGSPACTRAHTSLEIPAPLGSRTRPTGRVGSPCLSRPHQPMKSGTENLLIKPTRLPSAPPPLRGFCCAEMPSSRALQT